MKVVMKPVMGSSPKQVPAIAALAVPRPLKPQATERSYQQLVTSQGVTPERANQLLGRTK